MSEQDRLLEVASAVESGSDVDWDEVEQQLGDDRERSVVRELRLIAGIAYVARHPSTKPTTSSADPAAAEQVEAPESWGHLRLLEQIGQGSFGIVYRAWDSKLERHVALKLVRPSGVSNAFDLSRALKEARLLARIHHPNVVNVLGADCHDGQFGLWMELIDGLTLEQLLSANGTMSAREAAAIGVDLCHALAAVHRARLLHRDIKASNVMREEGGRIVLMDFGAGRRIPAPDDPDEALAGTPLYLAPELLAGQKPSVASDTYSLGVLLYHLVSGGYPVTGTDRHTVAQAHEGRQRASLRDVRPNLPSAFVDVIDRALAPDPTQRYRTAGEFGATLAALAGIPYTPDRTLRWSWKAAAVAALAAVAILAGATQFTRDRPAEQRQSSAPAAAAPPHVEGSAPYDVMAAFHALRNGETVRLTAGSRVAPGDQLFLTLETSRPVFAYVVNQDDAGDAYLLFPLPGFELQNPVPLGAVNRLPGTRNGEPHHWEVTSVGGREHFLVYVATERLTSFEDVLASLPRAELGRPVALTAGAFDVLRGVGGVAKSSAASALTIPGAAEMKPLPEGREAATGVWARRITFDNPAK